MTFRTLEKQTAWILTLLTVLTVITACGTRGALPQDLPTQITDLEALATHQIMTQNAPPPLYRSGVKLPRIDQGTDALSNWHALVYLEFNGFFAGTSRQTSASSQAEIWFNLIGNRRRVVWDVKGELLVPPSTVSNTQRLEGVRIGQDVFVVQDDTCTPVDPDTTAAAAIADLSAGDMIGGVREALPDGRKAVVNAAEVWRFNFLQDSLVLPSVLPRDGGQITMLGSELWFAPEHHTAVRFYVTLDVENVTVFGSNLPVTGQVVMRYDLYEIGQEVNITIPFGC